MIRLLRLPLSAAFITAFFSRGIEALTTQDTAPYKMDSLGEFAYNLKSVGYNKLPGSGDVMRVYKDIQSCFASFPLPLGLIIRDTTRPSVFDDETLHGLKMFTFVDPQLTDTSEKDPSDKECEAPESFFKTPAEVSAVQPETPSRQPKSLVLMHVIQQIVKQLRLPMCRKFKSREVMPVVAQLALVHGNRASRAFSNRNTTNIMEGHPYRRCSPKDLKFPTEPVDIDFNNEIIPFGHYCPTLILDQFNLFYNLVKRMPNMKQLTARPPKEHALMYLGDALADVHTHVSVTFARQMSKRVEESVYRELADRAYQEVFTAVTFAYPNADLQMALHAGETVRAMILWVFAPKSEDGALAMPGLPCGSNTSGKVTVNIGGKDVNIGSEPYYVYMNLPTTVQRPEDSDLKAALKLSYLDEDADYMMSVRPQVCVPAKIFKNCQSANIGKNNTEICTAISKMDDKAWLLIDGSAVEKYRKRLNVVVRPASKFSSLFGWKAPKGKSIGRVARVGELYKNKHVAPIQRLIKNTFARHILTLLRVAGITSGLV